VFTNYSVKKSHLPHLYEIKKQHKIEGKHSLAQFEILNKDSLHTKIRELFFHTLKDIGKYEIISKRLKREFDSTKIDSKIEITYNGNGRILDIAIHLPFSIINDFIFEKDVNLIYNNIKKLALNIEANNGHIYLNTYDPDWRKNYKKITIDLTEFYKEDSLNKGFKYYIVKKSSQDQWEISSDEKYCFTKKTTFADTGIYPYYIDSIVSKNIDFTLKSINKYKQYYQAKKTKEKDL
jgi:hypothetical protein